MTEDQYEPMETKRTMEPGRLTADPLRPAENADAEIDLVELFYLLWGHVRQILLCLAAGAVLALAGTWFFVAPTYRATAKIYIVSASNDSVVNLADLQIGSQLTADYQKLLVSRPLLQDVIANLGMEMEYKTLEGMITIKNDADTRILDIIVTDTEPERAADIANELVNQASIYLPRIMETDTPNLVESAVPPTRKTGPSYTRNTLIGALLGLVLACAVLVVRYLLNDTFITPDDVEKHYGVPPLAVIPEGDLGDFGRAEKKKNRKGAAK